jgi:hypothetical protein
MHQNSQIRSSQIVTLIHNVGRELDFFSSAFNEAVSIDDRMTNARGTAME